MSDETKQVPEEETVMEETAAEETAAEQEAPQTEEKAEKKPKKKKEKGITFTREQVEQTLQAEDTARLISDFLRRQSKQDRQLFVRRYWYLDDIRALCSRFGMGESQVKSRLHRMRKKLKEALEQEGVAV